MLFWGKNDLLLLTWQTNSAIRVTFITWPALTDSSVIDSRAISVDCTVTGVNTFLIPTSEGVSALRVSEALVLPALLVWVAFKPGPTLAFGLMVVYKALGINTTVFKLARVLTIPVDACQVERAFQVTLTAS